MSEGNGLWQWTIYIGGSCPAIEGRRQVSRHDVAVGRWALCYHVVSTRCRLSLRAPWPPTTAQRQSVLVVIVGFVGPSP